MKTNSGVVQLTRLFASVTSRWAAIAILFAAIPVHAQVVAGAQGLPHSAAAANFAESFAVRDLPPVKMGFTKKKLATDPAYEEKNASNKKPIRKFDPNAIATPDAALWSEQTGRYGPVPSAPALPTVSFEGISIVDTQALGQGFLPPDTTGAVGPTQFVQAVNSAFRVWDKTGSPLTSAATLSSLFATLPGACATTNDGDPIVLYDQLADRWLISQFCVSVADPNNHQLIAISKTGDATGAYYLYDFVMPNNKFNDYPHFGVWSDGYYMTDNQFNQAGTAFQGGGAFAFNRVKMLTGDPTANFIYFDMDTIVPGVGGVLPASLDGFTPPPSGAPALFSYFEANEYGDPGDRLRIFQFHADFATPANSTFTENVTGPLTVAAFDPREVPSGSRNVVPQPSPATTAQYLDVISDRLMFRMTYRNFGASESLILNHTVNAATNPAFRAGVRFYQLTRSTPAGAFSITEQQTFAGGAGDTEHRWMGSAAINHQGDIAVGYSVSSTSVFPSVRYAAKFGTDPAGSGLAQGEQTIIAGGGIQTSSSGRWGDYSQMSIDPVDDCTFWYTQEYLATNGSAPWKTRIAKFAPRACTTSPRGTITGTITNCSTGLPVANAIVSTTGGVYSRSTSAAGTYSMTVVPGTYTASATALNYSTATSGSLTVSNGGSATFNGCLVGFPVINAVAPATVTAENAVLLNAAPDPGETLTLSVPLKNVGTQNTVNLVATLQATGGVTAPTAPQNYGVVAAGGATVARPFTFTAAGACGTNITPTLSLQDGATNLGTIGYSLRLGTIVPSGTPMTFANTTPILIPAGQPATTSGVGSPYPSTISVSGYTSAVGNITVKLKQFSHTYPSDVDLLLVSPTGQKMIIMSDAGGSTAVSNVNITLDDTAVGLLPSGAIATGAYRPTNLGTATDTFAAPAPAAPYASPGTFGSATLVSTFAGQNVNGTWSLYAVDDGAADVGSINGGWEISFTPPLVDVCAIPRALDVDLNGSYEARADGQMMVRYLLGVRGSALTANSIGVLATRTDPAAILTHLDNIRPLLDVDGNGQVDALTDGLMILRYMLGLTGAAMTQGAIGVGATRTVPQMDSYMQNITPATPGP